MGNNLTTKKKLIIFVLVAFVALIWAAVELREPPVQQPHNPIVVAENVSLTKPVIDTYIKSVEIGTSLNADNLIYNITDWYFADEISGHKADDGNCYLLVQANVKNENTTSKSFNNYNYTILYNDKYEYYDCFGLSKEYIKGYDNIIPLETIDGIFAYEVPVEVKDANSLVFTVSTNVYEQKYKWNIILK